MADIVVANEGERYLLDAAFRLPWLLTESWQIHLFKNAVTITKDVVLADLVEADFSSYAPKTLLRGTWFAAATTLGRAVTFYGTLPLEWFSTASPQNVFGYYVTANGGAVLLWAKNFDAAVTVTNLQPAQVLPQFSLRSEFEP